MARAKEFDIDTALEAAIDVFREHGFAGTSAAMLTEAMSIGRQSLYDTFGDKWQLYCASVKRYSASETQAHLAVLRNSQKAIDGIRQMIERVVRDARKPCLGVGSITEFGDQREELVNARAAAARALRAALIDSIRAAQVEGDVAANIEPQHAADFIVANVAAIRIAARGGADSAGLTSLGRLVLQALR